MVIRNVKNGDDKRVIAELIYKTDRYIYPSLAKSSYEEAIQTLIEMLDNEGTAFNFDNVYVFEYQKKIIGITVVIDEHTKLTSDYSKWLGVNKYQDHVIENYFLPIKNYKKENELYILALTIDENYRRRGFGTKFLEYFAKQNVKTLSLDVLVENTPALELYKSQGFKVINEYYGYNGYREKKPKCYHMEKQL